MEGRPVVRESTLTELQSKSAATADKLRRTSRLPGRSQPRARMRGIPDQPPKREESPAHSASSRRTRITSHSGRSTPTIRATSGG